MCGADTGERVGDTRKQRKGSGGVHGQESKDSWVIRLQPWRGKEGDVCTRRKRRLQEEEEDELVLLASLVLFCVLQCFVALFFS